MPRRSMSKTASGGASGSTTSRSSTTTSWPARASASAAASPATPPPATTNLMCARSPQDDLRSSGDPLLRRGDLVEREQASLTGGHPAEHAHGMTQPLDVGDDRHALPRRPVRHAE